MKNLNSMLLICLFSLFYYNNPVQSSELGFTFGSYSKESDLTGTIISYVGDQYWEYVQITPGDIYIDPYDSQDFFPGLQGVERGGRSTASLLGVIWIHKFFNPHFEVEHTLNGAFSAGKSAKPHTLIYSSNLNLILPWNPEIFLVRIKPFLGAGIGYVFNFSFGSDRENSSALNFSKLLGNYGNFQYNFGGGGKIKIHEEWWLRISLRDYILPSMKKVDPFPKWSSSNSTVTFPIPASLVYKEMIVRNTTHNISFAISLVHLD